MTTTIKHFFAGIRVKILFFSLLSSLIPFMILGFAAWYNYQKQINENVIQYTQQIMSLSADKLDDFLDKLDEFYYAVYSKNTIQVLAEIQEHSLEGVKAKLSLADTISQLRSYYGLSHFIPYITILSYDGQILYQNDLALASDYDFSQAEWFQEFVRSGNSSWIVSPQRLPYHESRFTAPSIDYITYARKIPSDRVNEKPYFFLMEFDSRQIFSLLSSLIEGENSSLFILMDQKPIYELRRQVPSSALSGDAILDKQPYAAPAVETFHGSEYLVNQYFLEHSSLSILCVNNMEELLADVPNLKAFTLSLILVSFFLTLLLTNFFSKMLVKPIQKLKAVTYKVQKGNLDVSVPVLPHDEIGELESASILCFPISVSSSRKNTSIPSEKKKCRFTLSRLRSILIFCIILWKPSAGSLRMKASMKSVKSPYPWRISTDTASPPPTSWCQSEMN